MDAVEIASQVRSGRRRAVDVVRKALADAEASQDALNAFTLIDHEGAIARAEAIDVLVDRGTDPGPLAGVPVALKDLIDQAGLPNTLGSSLPPEVPHNSATVVRRLGAAGAVIVGRTGLHEFAFGFTSENHWFGPVRNPWDVDTSPGGSSGGSAAAVAAGVTPVSIGTDTGGSVRVPAAMCGLFGLKVTHGRVPLSRVYPLVPSFDTVGPLARSVDDLTAVYLTIAGDDPEDPWSRPEPVGRPGPLDGALPTIGIVEQWFEPPHTRRVADALSRFVDDATGVGFRFIRIDDEALRPIHATTMASRAEVLRIHGERFRDTPEIYGPDLRIRLEESIGVTVDDMVDAALWASRARAAIERHSADGVAAFLSPTVGVTAKTIGEDYVDVDGESVFHRVPLSSFTAPVNAIGSPAIALPLAGTGTPPVSVQLVGPMWSEATLLAIGRRLEIDGLVAFTEPPLSFS